jgi:D-sedoheptulose 7-phosphate isomerase
MIDHISAIVAQSLEVKRRYFAEHAGDLVRAAEIVCESFRAGGKVLLCGNGGSSTDAQHIAGELVNQFSPVKRRALPALALSTDGGVITSIANDTGFENIFARQVEAFGVQNDVLIVITTSGTSANIVAAVERARALELKVIGLLGRDGGSVAPLCDLALIVENTDTQRIQETHNLISHILCELVEIMLFREDKR